MVNEETLRTIIREECERVVATHLCNFTVGCIYPMNSAIVELQQSAKQLMDGQALIEKHLAGAFNDDSGEEWRSSLDD